MKTTRELTSLFLSCGIALAMVASAAAQTADGYAKVVRIKGLARSSQNGKWAPLKVGDVLKAGTVVQTGKEQGSYVDIVLRESGEVDQFVPPAVGTPQTSLGRMAGFRAAAQQNVVRLNEDTALGIDKLTSQNTGAAVVTDTQLDLKQGRITGNVKKLTPASKYEIKLPNGVAGIRGTVFEISADGLVRVSSGSVVLAVIKNGQPVTQVIGAGEQFDSSTGRLTPITAGQMQFLNDLGIELRSIGEYNASGTMSNDQTLRPLSPNR